MVRFKSVSVAVVAACMLSGCVAHSGPNQQAGALIGGITGGVVGNQFGKGSGKTAATALGAVIGAMTGSEVGRSMDRPRVIVHENRYRHTNRYRYGLPPSRFQECEVYPTISERRACTQGVNRRELEIQRGLDREAYNGGLSGYHGN